MQQTIAQPRQMQPITWLSYRANDSSPTIAELAWQTLLNQYGFKLTSIAICPPQSQLLARAILRAWQDTPLVCLVADVCKDAHQTLRTALGLATNRLLAPSQPLLEWLQTTKPWSQELPTEQTRLAMLPSETTVLSTTTGVGLQLTCGLNQLLVLPTDLATAESLLALL